MSDFIHASIMEQVGANWIAPMHIQCWVDMGHPVRMPTQESARGLRRTSQRALGSADALDGVEESGAESVEQSFDGRGRVTFEESGAVPEHMLQYPG
jgi:hypothetical protein